MWLTVEEYRQLKGYNSRQLAEYHIKKDRLPSKFEDKIILVEQKHKVKLVEVKE